ncbi:hypothetical protein B6D60_00875 [candidate division KSB1 bacterium 4484_87]|nr:MAG: hypothetical protein B6D60_00875 [candidate division KSB1 bacterium 4484_87]
MKIQSIEFIGSFTQIKQLPKRRLPEVAFAGRSNVGKSTLINVLANRKNIAKTSSTPGKTRTLNYYLINDNFYFVDLPGYGFAKVSQRERQQWQKLIERYFSSNKYLRGIIQIIDSRHSFTKLDLEMVGWLAHSQLPVLVVATKTDKLPGSKRKLILDKIENEARQLGVAETIPFSAVTKQGKLEILKSIFHLIEE